ncbi:MAG: zinc-ribbon domain containing protein [Candidatus Paceibacterota bacterium]
MGQTLTCVDCGEDFEFTDGEEKFYEEKGFASPKRCRKCRNKKKQDSGGAKKFRKY